MKNRFSERNFREIFCRKILTKNDKFQITIDTQSFFRTVAQCKETSLLFFSGITLFLRAKVFYFSLWLSHLRRWHSSSGEFAAPARNGPLVRPCRWSSGHVSTCNHRSAPSISHRRCRVVVVVERTRVWIGHRTQNGKRYVSYRYVYILIYAILCKQSSAIWRRSFADR